MYTQPSLRLTQLRKEKNISQKAAAQQLEISQALLSHYERGIRECNLAFLVRAASFYGVSCDYLLGVSMDKGNASPDVQPDYTQSAALKGSASAAVARRLLNNSLTLLFSIIEECNNKDLSKHCMDIFSLQIYKLYYYMYMASAHPPGYLTLPKERFPYQIDICLTRAEMMAKHILLGETWAGSNVRGIESGALPDIDHDSLERTYSSLASSFFQVLRGAQLAIDKKEG